MTSRQGRVDDVKIEKEDGSHVQKTGEKQLEVLLNFQRKDTGLAQRKQIDSE